MSSWGNGPVQVRLTVGQTVIGQADIRAFSHRAACCDGDIGLGQVCSASITATLTGARDLLGATVIAELGGGSPLAWHDLGTFIVSECRQSEDSTAITAQDAAWFALSGAYVPTVSSGATVYNVLEDVADQCGLDVEQTTLNLGLGISVTGDLTGHTCRAMLGYLAALCGCNCVISRAGEIRFVWFTDSGESIDPDRTYAGTYQRGGTSTLLGLKCTVPDGDSESTISAGNAEKAVEVVCPLMTQSRLSALWSALGGYQWPVLEVSCYDGAEVLPGDLVTVVDRAENSLSLPVMEVSLSVDGGCRCTLRSYGKGDTARGADSIGPREQRLRRVQSTADSALLSANGKNKNFYQASAPTSSAGLTEGDLWFDTANGNRVSEWTGSAWTLRPFGALAVTDLDAGSITTGTLNAARIDVSDLLSRRVTITETFSIGYGPDLLEVGDDGFYYTTDFDRMTPTGIFVSTRHDTAEVRANLVALELDGGAKTAKLAVFEPSYLSEVAGITVSTSGVNIKGTLTKNGNPYLKTASRGISYACAAGSTGGGTYTFGTDISGEAGYTPISIIGWTTGNNNVVLPRLYLGNNNTQLNFTVRNVGNAAVSGTLNVVFLFQAN